MSKNREFSILKWIIFPLMSIVLAGIVGWFNYQVFGVIDGASYIIAVALITFFSIAINKFTNSQYRTLAIAAFTCEVFLTAILIINAAYSLSVQREMSVARQDTAERASELKEIRRLDRVSRREAVKQMGERRGVAQAFSANERWLFWIMVSELALFAVCAFALYGIAQVQERREDQMRTVERRDAVGKNSTRVATQVAQPALDSERVASVATQKQGIQALREHLSVISSYYPGWAFKADPRDDHILVRLVESKRGKEKTIPPGVKLRLTVLDDCANSGFRGRLIDYLIKHGMPLDAEKGREEL